MFFIGTIPIAAEKSDADRTAFISPEIQGQRPLPYQPRPQAWEVAQQDIEGQRSDPLGLLVPNVTLVEFEAIVPQKTLIFLLKRLLPVMLLLPVDVGEHRIQILRADGKRAVSPLP